MKKKVLAIMLVAVSIMLISACEKKEKLYEIPDLSQYKTDYVGDSSNVINIVRVKSIQKDTHMTV